MISYLNEAVYPTYIVHMHLTFLPIALFALIGLGYYISMVIGTIVVFVGVMICFEIARRASLFRPLFGIKGELRKAIADPPASATQFRYEVNMAYRTRHAELLQAYMHDHGELPVANTDVDPRMLGRLRPAG